MTNTKYLTATSFTDFPSKFASPSAFLFVLDVVMKDFVYGMAEIVQ